MVLNFTEVKGEVQIRHPNQLFFSKLSQGLCLRSFNLVEKFQLSMQTYNHPNNQRIFWTGDTAPANLATAKIICPPYVYMRQYESKSKCLDTPSDLGVFSVLVFIWRV